MPYSFTGRTMVNWLPTAWFALQFEAAAVGGDNLFHDRETDARALDAEALRLLAPVELGENRRPLAWRDADAAVAHRDGEVRPRRAVRTSTVRLTGEYLTALSSRFHSALDRASSSASIGTAPSVDALDDGPRLLHVPPEFLDHLPDQRCAVAPLEAVLPRPGLHPAEVEERLDEPREPVGGARLGVVAHPAAVVAEVVMFAQHVRELPQRRERRSELVRHGGDEVGFQPRDRQFAADGDENQDARQQRESRQQREARQEQAPPLHERLPKGRRFRSGHGELPRQPGLPGPPGHCSGRRRARRAGPRRARSLAQIADRDASRNRHRARGLEPVRRRVRPRRDQHAAATRPTSSRPP